MSDPIQIEVRAGDFEERNVALFYGRTAAALKVHTIHFNCGRGDVYMPERFPVMWVRASPVTENGTDAWFAGPFASAGQLLAYLAFRHQVIVPRQQVVGAQWRLCTLTGTSYVTPMRKFMGVTAHRHGLTVKKLMSKLDATAEKAWSLK